MFVLSCVLKQIQSEGDIGTDDVEESYWKLLLKKNYDFIPEMNTKRLLNSGVVIG